MVLVFGFVLLLVGLVLSPVFFWIVQWRRVAKSEIEALLQKADMEAALKQDLVNRGMSADDIVKLLHAAPPPGVASPSWLGAVLAGLFKGAKAAKEKAGHGKPLQQMLALEPGFELGLSARAAIVEDRQYSRLCRHRAATTMISTL